MLLSLNSFLVLGALLFAIGLFGTLSKRNAVSVLMGIEIMLNAVNITMVAFASSSLNTAHGARLTGQVFAVFIITVAAAEAAVEVKAPRARATRELGVVEAVCADDALEPLTAAGRDRHEREVSLFLILGQAKDLVERIGKWVVLTLHHVRNGETFAPEFARLEDDRNRATDGHIV